MRQKNRLYTVNKFNKVSFLPDNIFAGGGLKGLATADRSANPWDYTDDGGNVVDQFLGTQRGQDYLGTKNWLGISKKNNPFSKASLHNTFSKKAIGNAISSAAPALAAAGIGAGGVVAGKAIAGGLSSGAGNAISGLGSTVGGALSSVNPMLGATVGAAFNIAGGVANRLVGSKTDEAKLREVNQNIAMLNNFNSNAGSFDEIQGPQAISMDTGVYKGGILSGRKARRKNRELQEKLMAARDWAYRSVDNNIDNLVNDQLSDALANYSAYGGKINKFDGGDSTYGLGGTLGALGLMQQDRYFDTIDKRSEAIAGKNTLNTAYTGGAKTFADGGLQSSFFDEFGTDPIGAVVRYNRGLEEMAAQEEAKKIEAAREAEYADMQKRLLSLETKNQGLEALLNAVPTTNPLPEIPESSYTPSPATYRANSGNSNWDYIEDQLRRSGKFNDVQIQGIKYNLQRESGIGAHDGGDNGTARGIAQWRGKRQPSDMSLEGQTKFLIDTVSNYDGNLHWINKDDYNGFLNARTPEEAHYYLAKGYERPHKDILAKVKRSSDMSLKRLNAFGGELGTNGTDFTNGLLEVNEGGRHESNPLEGVPMGLDPQGIPNLVEEGETVYNNYVFSDRMNVPEFMYKELGLGGIMTKGKSKKGISFADASKKLAEESKQRPNDPISQDGLQASLARLAEIQETERMKKNAKEYTGLAEYAHGGKLNNKYSGKGSQGQRMTIGYNPVLPPVVYGLQGFQLPNIDTYTKRSSNYDFGENPVDIEDVGEFTEEGLLPDIEDVTYFGDPETREQYAAYGLDSYEPLTEGEYNAPDEKRRDIKKKKYQTWSRYMPAAGAGIMTLTDALGITNKPDYSMADGIEAYANAIGNAPQVGYKPNGNYLRYTPMDIWYQQNALNAQARATDRAIANTNSPARVAGLLASGYNSQLASGDLYRKALEYNDANRKDVAEFNRKTNMFNSQMGLEAAMANARYKQAAQQMGLTGLGHAAALRDSIDARVGAARSTNLNNFLTSLGNIGRENFAMNQLNWDSSRRYRGELDGTSGYEEPEEKENKTNKAKGGKLNQNKRRR